MISALTGLGASHLSSGASAASLSDTLPDGLEPGGNESPDGADELSLSRPESSSPGDVFYPRIALQVRSHSHLKAEDGGHRRAMTPTSLRFHYDFEVDGDTRIRVRVKASLQHARIPDGDDQLQAIKFRAKLGVSTIQQNVSTAVAPLLDAPEISDGAKHAVSQSLELFGQLSDAASALFLESESLDGDRLITNMVKAFNRFSETIGALFQPMPPAADLEPVPPEVALPADEATDPLPRIPQDPTQPDESPANEPAIVEMVPTPSGDLEPGKGVSPAVPESQSSVGTVICRLRLQVIQSLTSLVAAFDSDSTSLLISRSVFKASIQIAAGYDSSGSGVDGPAPPEGLFDAEV